MGGGHHHGGRHFRRRSRFGGPVYLNYDDSVPVIVDDPELELVDFDADAGDILPTFVTPTDALNYIQEVDTGFNRLDASITRSTVSDSFKTAWAAELGAWRVFAAAARASVGWLNSKAVMDQTDKWSADLKNWDQNFQAQGGKDIGPAPMPPGQGIPSGSGVAVSDVTKLIAAAGVVAAIVVFGPKLSGLMKG